MKIIKEDKYNHIIAEIDKPTLILFTTTRCTFCRTMEKILKEFKSEKILIFKITSESESLIKKYNIRAFPTILTFDKNKKPIEKLVGLKSKIVVKESIGLIS